MQTQDHTKMALRYYDVTSTPAWVRDGGEPVVWLCVAAESEEHAIATVAGAASVPAESLESSVVGREALC